MFGSLPWYLSHGRHEIVPFQSQQHAIEAACLLLYSLFIYRKHAEVIANSKPRGRGGGLFLPCIFHPYRFIPFPEHPAPAACSISISKGMMWRGNSFHLVKVERRRRSRDG